MKFLGSPLIIITIMLIFSFFMIGYWALLTLKKKRYRILLFSLRSCSLLLIIFLLVNPWIGWNKNAFINQKIAVIYDLSTSITSHFDNNPLEYNEIQKRIASWGKEKHLDLSLFRLGPKISILDNMDANDMFTDFSDIPNFISIEQPHQTILITDGKATIGKNINEIEFNELKPIHCLGVGPILRMQDIEIQDVILPDILIEGDTVEIKIRIKSLLNDDVLTNIQIINSIHGNIYEDEIIINKGNHLNEIVFKINSNVLSGFNIVQIDPTINEIKSDNNKFSFNGNLGILENDILFITGSLSSNTQLITRIFQEIQNANLYHYYRTNQNQWNEEFLKIDSLNLKMILLDNFPIYIDDQDLFQRIVALSNDKQIPVVYIEGPMANLNGNKIISNIYNSFESQMIEVTLSTDISTESNWLDGLGINLSLFPPQKRLVKWITNNSSFLQYIDGSTAIGAENNLYLISIPSLASSYFKSNIDSQSIISDIIKKVIVDALYGSDEFIRLDIDGNYFYKGERINLSIHNVGNIDLKDFAIYSINEKDTLKLTCDEKILDANLYCTTNLLNSGIYTFYAQALLPNEEIIYSKQKSIIVQDVKIEMKDLVQEHLYLKEVSHQTGGSYAPIDSLDNMLAHIDITPVPNMRKHEISALSTQNYWWILLVLFSIEWYYRKKLGLL